MVIAHEINGLASDHFITHLFDYGVMLGAFFIIALAINKYYRR